MTLVIFYPGLHSYSDVDDIMTLSFDVGDELSLTTLRCCHLYLVFMAGFIRERLYTVVDSNLHTHI